MKTRELLAYMSILEKGNWDGIYQRIKEKKYDLEGAKEALSKLNCSYVTMVDKEYPEYLKRCLFKPPFVLFYYGDISLIADYMNNVAIIGKRECSDYGAEATRELTEAISKKYVVVSGMAAGIDSIAHETAIKNKGRTIAVLGTGIERCYPSSSKHIYEYIKKNKSDLLISEYPFDSYCENSFPARNRLIAYFSRAVVITEANMLSGTSITASFANECGRDILCVPYARGKDSLCNDLIKTGAALVETADDVMFELKKQ